MTLLFSNRHHNCHFLYSLFKSAKYLPSIFCEFKFISDREQLCKEYFLVASFHSSSHRYAPVPEQNLNDYMTQGINWSTFEQRIEKMTLKTVDYNGEGSKAKRVNVNLSGLVHVRNSFIVNDTLLHSKDKRPFWKKEGGHFSTA